MELEQQHCVPCKEGAAPMAHDKAHELLKQLSGWHVADKGKWLKKSYKFKDFASALHFVNKVGEIAEAANHHPDIELGWGYVHIRLQTHAAGGLHQNDFIVAARINQL